jgi:hypothetical protein
MDYPALDLLPPGYTIRIVRQRGEALSYKGLGLIPMQLDHSQRLGPALLVGRHRRLNRAIAGSTPAVARAAITPAKNRSEKKNGRGLIVA